MTQNPPPIAALPYESQAWGDPRDVKQIGLLVIFHYIWGGLGFLFSSIMIIDVIMGVAMVKGAFQSAAMPQAKQMGWLLIITCSVVLVVGYAVSALNLYSARCMQNRRHRTFSLVMAGINCVSVPFGTALGICTFVVLLRDTVEPLYARGRSHGS